MSFGAAGASGAGPDGPAAAGESRPFNHHSRPYAGLIVCDGETAAAT